MRTRWMPVAFGAVLGASIATLSLSNWSTPGTAVVQAQPAKPATPPAPAKTPGAKPTQARQRVVVNLKHGTDDLHAAFMAYKLANGMLAAGADVTLFLNMEGTRLADKRQPEDLGWGSETTRLRDLQKTFADTGGKVLVCPHCAHAVGLRSQDLRPGAQISSDEAVVAAMMGADKVIDY